MYGSIIIGVSALVFMYVLYACFWAWMCDGWVCWYMCVWAQELLNDIESDDLSPFSISLSKCLSRGFLNFAKTVKKGDSLFFSRKKAGGVRKHSGIRFNFRRRCGNKNYSNVAPSLEFFFSPPSLLRGTFFAPKFFAVNHNSGCQVMVAAVVEFERAWKFLA